jgi:hypothetical protein
VGLESRIISRRGILFGILAAPLIVRTGILMPIIVRDPRWYGVLSLTTREGTRLEWKEIGDDHVVRFEMPLGVVDHYSVWYAEGERARNELLSDIAGHAQPLPWS